MKNDVFDPIEVEWDGREYRIPPHKVMGAIHRVERYITFPEIVEYAERSAIPMGALSSAYAAVLRYAGAKVTDAEVYESLIQTDDPDEIMEFVQNLLAMMLPKSARRKIEKAQEEGVSEEDETKASESTSGNSKGGEPASSKKRSKRS